MNKKTCMGLIFEDIVNLKKFARDVSTAKEGAVGAAIKGYNPYDAIYQAHVKARNEAIKSVKNEFKKAKGVDDPNKITMSTNYITGGQYVEPKSKTLIIGMHMYMPTKKGFFGRLFTGSMGNWFSDVGVVALKTYVTAFAGKEFGKQVSKKNVFNAVGEGSNEGKTSYFVVLKLPAMKND